MGLQALFVVLPILLFATTVASEPETICDLSKEGGIVVNFTVVETFAFKVKNLNNPKSFDCTWNLNQSISDSSILFWKNVLDPKDTLEIYDTMNPNKTLIFNNKNGAITPGLLPITSSNIQVVLKLEPKPSITDRVFNNILNHDAKQIEIQGFGGQFEFPKFLVENNKSLQKYSFQIQPSESLSSEWQFVLSFEHLPSSYSFKIDGKAFSDKNNQLPIIFLPTNRSILFEWDKWDKAVNNTVRFVCWPVISNCSKNVDLSAEKNSIPILLPDVKYRTERQLSMVSCATIFNNKAKKPIVVSFDVNSMPDHGLVNPGDQIAISGIDKDFAGHDVFTGKQSLRSENYYYQAEQLFVSYDSFFRSDKPGNFKAPTVSYVSQGGNLGEVVPGTPISTTIDMKGETKVVAIAKAKDPTHRVVAWLSGPKDKKVLTKLPPETAIKVYNSDALQAKPLFTFGGSILGLPSQIPSNTDYIRVVIEKDDKNADWAPFQLVVGAIKPEQFNCRSSSLWSGTFELNGTLAEECSWLVPAESADKSLALALNYVNLPAETSLELTIFETKNPDTTIILFKGPKAGTYLPDLLLDASKTYEFKVKATKMPTTHVILELSKRTNYLQTINEKKNLLENLKSPNYPGAYPVNMNQGWAIDAGKNSKILLTWLDIDLAKDHSVALLSPDKKNYVNLTGTPNLATLPDMLLPNVTLISLSASKFNGNEEKIAGRGFNVNLTYYSCGDEIILSKNAATFQFVWNGSLADAQSPKCLWTVVEPNSKADGAFGDQYLEFEVRLENTLKDTEAELTILDTISLRPDLRHNANGSIIDKAGSYRTSLRSAIVIYDFSKSLKNKKNATIHFTVKSEECKNNNYTLPRCASSDRCITKWMRCNGVNECGDWSDELYCHGSIPAPIINNSGVSGWVVVLVLMPLGALLGILGYIWLPILMQKFRQGRYSEFRSDFSDVN